MIQQKRMANIDKALLMKEISAADESFNLYQFIENY
jgi:hypothetical protein